MSAPAMRGCCSVALLNRRWRLGYAFKPGDTSLCPVPNCGRTYRLKHDDVWELVSKAEIVAEIQATVQEQTK